MSESSIITCAVTGVLTNPDKYKVPVTPQEMAAESKRAWEAGATVVHLHFRDQSPGMGWMPTWDTHVCVEIVDAIRAACPGILINCSTGIMGDDISGPVGVLRATKPEIAAMNAGTLNYLKTRRSGEWAWPPLLFDNPVDKIQQFLDVMNEESILPELECFDTGIVRSIKLFQQVGMIKDPLHVSFVMGIASGMAGKASWLPLLIEELPEGAHFQSIVIGREEVWDVHRRCAELGGDVRTGLEDTFYLPDGTRPFSNGPLVEQLVKIVRETGREPATLEETRAAYGLSVATA